MQVHFLKNFVLMNGLKRYLSVGQLYLFIICAVSAPCLVVLPSDCAFLILLSHCRSIKTVDWKTIDSAASSDMKHPHNNNGA